MEQNELKQLRAKQAKLVETTTRVLAAAQAKLRKYAEEVRNAETAHELATRELVSFDKVYGDRLGGVKAPTATASTAETETTAKAGTTKTGKKRGRPAKVKAETVSAKETTAKAGTTKTGKKRGRPAKVKAETTAKAGTPKTGKKRGRPAKVKAEAAATEPKKRGRPAKAKPAAVKTSKKGAISRATGGRRDVAEGRRPPITVAIATVMGEKVMNAAEIVPLLEAQGWQANTNDQKTYAGYMLSQHKDIFEKAPNKARGYYRVKPDAHKVIAEKMSIWKSRQSGTSTSTKEETVTPRKAKANGEASEAKASKPNGAGSSVDQILSEVGIGQKDVFTDA